MQLKPISYHPVELQTQFKKTMADMKNGALGSPGKLFFKIACPHFFPCGSSLACLEGRIVSIFVLNL